MNVMAALVDCSCSPLPWYDSSAVLVQNVACIITGVIYQPVHRLLQPAPVLDVKRLYLPPALHAPGVIEMSDLSAKSPGTFSASTSPMLAPNVTCEQ